MKYNKLVRDQIPNLIKEEGYNPITKTLTSKEYSNALETKLVEEVQEYLASKELEELADILEVVYALCKVNGYNKDQLMQCYHDKHLHRGGFEKQIYLMSKEK